VDDASCASCGTHLAATAKFCSECGTPVAKSQSAEYKQVTVLFADVVRSMDLAAAVGSERLREIMTELLERAAAVVKRYDGTVDKFTGDGLMAVFGAPVALEDHAVRACLAALGLQDEAQLIAAEVRECDGVDVQLRVGLNSGQVIAGEIGSGAFGYTAMGEQVGMAQRMESAAPPGGVMLSTSTARLVEHAAALGDTELVQIKGADDPVPARRLFGMARQDRRRDESVLVGRRWEMSAVEGLLDGAVEGRGAVVNLVGPPGIGKSRLVREISAIARSRDIDVAKAFCESHTEQIPFHAIAGLLRAAWGVGSLDGQTARARIRAGAPYAAAEDLLLLDDLLGIGEPDVALPAIDPDARRRRLTALVSAVALSRTTPAVYVIEDAHWVDEVSESMLAEFMSVIPQTKLLVLVTYRPEYRGSLSQVPGAQTISLAPLRDSETTALLDELVGVDASAVGLRESIAERAAGNPFFAEEIVRELAERGVLKGRPGAYVNTAELVEVSVPATLQTTIAARIDRLDPAAKRTLWAAAVIGSRFDGELLNEIGVEAALADLLAARLIDQVTFSGEPEYVFHHPLIRAVAYESQLKADRADLHRRLAEAIKRRGSKGKDAAAIAEHLEAAGDLRAAYSYHLSAAKWSSHRDIRAARAGWDRARTLADALPGDDDHERALMRIAPRLQLCASAWRVGRENKGFEELRALCIEAQDALSLAIAMYGPIVALSFDQRHQEAAALASEQFAILERCTRPALAVGVVHGSVMAKLLAGEPLAAFRLANWTIELAERDAAADAISVGSPVAMTLLWRGIAGMSLGLADWRDDIRRSIAILRSRDGRGMNLALMTSVEFAFCVTAGALSSNDDAVKRMDEAEQIAIECGDDIAVSMAQLARGLVLSWRPDDAERDLGLELLCRARDAQQARGTLLSTVAMADIRIVGLTSDAGQLDEAIEQGHAVVNMLVAHSEGAFRSAACAALVEALLRRGSASDIQEAKRQIERLAALPIDPGFVLNDIQLLRMRALLAKAECDDTAYREFAERYRAMAESLGFDGHMARAAAMT
jgi:adenylate cyclase